MQQNDPTIDRPGRRLRRTAFGLVSVVVVASGIAAGGQTAFADSASELGALQTAASDTTSANPPVSYALGEDVTEPGATVTVGPKAFTIDLAGHELDLDTLALSPAGAQLTITDTSLGRTGKLVVTHTSDTTHAAIEVDSADSLTILGAHVTATGANSTSSVAAAIGAGAGGSAPYDSGPITIDGASDVTATSYGKGAAIGGGSGGVNGVITVAPTVDTVDTVVHATASGSAAAIGSGAVPSQQRPAGGVQILNNAHVWATSAGSGAAIGGGFHGDGGDIEVHGYAFVDAEATATGEAAIGDGENATGNGSQVLIDDTTKVTAVGGGAGGAGIGGSKNATAQGDQVTIQGRAQVHASATAGPGIGGLGNTRGGSVTVSGAAQVWASGGGAGAGIGAGDASSYAFSLNVSGDAVVTAAGGGASASALGASTAGLSSTISNTGNATIVIPGGSSWTVPQGASASNDASLTDGGTITVLGTLSNSGTITNTGSLVGPASGSVSGMLVNSGTIVQNGQLNTARLTVTGNAYKLVYDGQGGKKSTDSDLVYAQTASAAGVSLATVTPPSLGNFTGWNTSYDNTGTPVDGTTDLSTLGSSATSTSTPAIVNIYAIYQLAPILPSTSLPQAVVGTPYSANVTALTGTAPITYSKLSGDLPAGLTLNTSSGVISGTPTTSGTFTLKVQAQNAYTTSSTYSIEVVHADLQLGVPSSTKRYLGGASIAVTLGGLQTNEKFVVTIAGKTVLSGQAPGTSTFVRTVRIPTTVSDGTQTVTVSSDGAPSGSAKILTASVSKALSLKLSAKKVKHGKKIVITISKLYTGESARVVISGKHGKTAVGKATSKGVYVVTLKSGLAKGKYTVTVTGAGTGRKASAKLTVS